MKTMKILLLAVVFTFSSVLTASTEPIKADPNTTISNEIGKLLKNPKFTVDQDLTAEVKVTINDNNEIVVLSVNSETPALEGFIKNRLNYNKLSENLTTGQKTFIVPVRITQEG